MKRKIIKKLSIFLFIFSLFLPLSYAKAGTILNAYKYAWSNNVGYINFEGVTVNDNTLSGYAWSTAKGLINFSPAQGGVLNDGNGHLSGSAWGEQLGWIDFSNVVINPPVGGTRKFSGTATGSLIGTLTFDCSFCDVRTDWEPTSIPPSTPPSPNTGGGGGGRVFPTTNTIPVNPNNTVPPSIPVTSATPSTTVANPPQSALTTNNNAVGLVSPSVPGAALFDVVSTPIQSAGQSKIPLIAFSTIAGILIALLGVFVIKFFLKSTSLRVAYYNATETAGLSGIIEKIVQKQFSHFKTVTMSKASTANYKGNIVVDLSGKHGKEAAKMAKLLSGRVESLPPGEIMPDADILVISGN